MLFIFIRVVHVIAVVQTEDEALQNNSAEVKPRRALRTTARGRDDGNEEMVIESFCGVRRMRMTVLDDGEDYVETAQEDTEDSHADVNTDVDRVVKEETATDSDEAQYIVLGPDDASSMNEYEAIALENVQQTDANELEYQVPAKAIEAADSFIEVMPTYDSIATPIEHTEQAVATSLDFDAAEQHTASAQTADNGQVSQSDENSKPLLIMLKSGPHQNTQRFIRIQNLRPQDVPPSQSTTVTGSDGKPKTVYVLPPQDTLMIPAGQPTSTAACK